MFRNLVHSVKGIGNMATTLLSHPPLVVNHHVLFSEVHFLRIVFQEEEKGEGDDGGRRDS